MLLFCLFALFCFSLSLVLKLQDYRMISLAWLMSKCFNQNIRKRLHKNKVQFPKDQLGLQTWPSFLYFGTPIWLPWRHEKTLYWKKKHNINRTSQNKCSKYFFTFKTCHSSLIIQLLQIVKQPFEKNPNLNHLSSTKNYNCLFVI